MSEELIKFIVSTIATLFVAWIGARYAVGKVEKKVDEAAIKGKERDVVLEKTIVAVNEGNVKTDGLVKQATEIHAAANSSLSNALAEIKLMTAKFEGAVKENAMHLATIADLQSERDKKVEVTKAPPDAAAPVIPPGTVVNMEVKKMDVKELNAPKKG